MSTFHVIIETAAGPLTLGRDTAAAAVATGRTLEREGIGTVAVAPPGGEPVPLAAFAASLVADQPDWDPA
ncbi:hypothetical protein OPKNFCMD_5752 [Methylobacterium crusticola]|uniref:Electron transfer flavoprotein subunit alpha/FixB family protein n=1 Tax=Methylobacterium crusticola TaxID=1697972 RepID=A0ABQ4R854_9HYPH|nr:hypothetical protein [Methylobacterium crusticola]GJD52984.1 hypothetical protein OPKNFCMD_5752 [Methylobacterium crusticola]